MRSYLISALILPFLVIATCFGQAREITSGDYFSLYSLALGTTGERPRMRKQTAEYFDNGKLVRTIEEIEEVQDKNRRWLTIVETVGKRRTHEEVVQFNNDYYCRSGVGSWKRSQTNCLSRGVRFVSDEGEGEFHYSVEQVTLDSAAVTLLRHYAADRPAGKSASDSVRVWENRFWMNRDYLIVRREYKSGVPSRSYTSLTEIYDFSKKINIEPPIK